MLVVTVPLDQVDAASDRLWRLGVRAVEERRPDGSVGFVELWTSVGDAAATARTGSELSRRWRVEVVDVDATPADSWRHHAEPVWIGDRLVIVPAWGDHETAGAPVVVAIEPGGAFGLGDHPTTQLCLERLVDHDALRGCRVLDVGCGTGVLSIVAAVLGAAHVRSIDVSPAAVEATADNARRNGVADLVVVDEGPAPAVAGGYDLVLANILAPELIALADELRRLTSPGGALVVSGILAGAHGHVLDALAPMVVERTDELDGWAAVTLRHG